MEVQVSEEVPVDYRSEVEQILSHEEFIARKDIRSTSGRIVSCTV